MNGAKLQQVEVYAIKVDMQLDTIVFNTLLTQVSPEKSRRIKRFLRYEDALRSLLGDLLARYLICQKFNLNNRQLQFNQTEYGKPFLLNNHHCFYNISHSMKWVVCALANTPVGIDVEKVTTVDPLLAERIFTSKEYEAFIARDISEQPRYFYNLWVLKESFIKAVGKGLSIPLASFVIKGDQGNYFTVYPEPDGVKYFYKQYEWDESYCLAVCAPINVFSEKVKVMTLNELQL